MADTGPSPDSQPSAVSPVSGTPTPPSTSTPPQPSTPSQPATPPPTETTPVQEPNANTTDPPTPSPPSPPPNTPPTPPNAPPPSNSGPPPNVTPPPVDTSPPPTSNAPPPSPPASSPPPSVASPPPAPDVLPPPPSNVSPPPLPTDSPPPAQTPPTLPPPNPPTGSPPPPPQSATPPEGSPPPTSSPTPPSLSPPRHSPPPSPSEPSVGSPPPENSPPPAAPNPPKRSPPPASSGSPPSPPSPPAEEPPSSSPPSDSHPASPPPETPVTPPVFQISPPSSITPSGSQTNPSSPNLPGHNSSFDAPPNAKEGSNGGIGHGGTVAIGVAVGVLLLGLIGLVAFCLYKRKKKGSGSNGGYVIPASIGSSPRSDGNLLVKSEHPGSYFGGRSGSDTPTDHGGFGQSRAWFTYQELLEATGGFSDENLLGEGGFGYVYKGILTDGRVVAVKQLKVGGGQGEREFQAEVEIISRIHHRHLVSLVGFCIWESKRLLVYDYVPNNTLHFHLHGGSSMDWATRVKIAAGAARGIAYLHEDCHPRIIHRDIKSSNILLDNNFEARVSDFGLAKLAMDADTHVSTRVMGTFGYMAPEYATSGKLTEKSDVYSFGVVLLELITGRKPVDESQPLGDESLVEWARPLLTRALDRGEFEGLVDPLLEKNYIESEIFRVIEAAAACVRHSATKRPRMGQVVRAIDGISDSGDLSNGLRVGESQLYNSAQHSAELRWFRRMAFGSQDISSDFFNSRTQNHGNWTQSGQHFNNLSAQHGQGGGISRQQSHQSSPNMGFSGEGGQNIDYSVQPALGGDISRQHSQSLQNLGSMRQSGQNVNFSAQQGLDGNVSRQHNQSLQNLGLLRQSGQNVDPSAQQGLGHNTKRQHSNSHSTYHSTMHSLNQGNRNPNISREDGLNR